MLAAVVIACLRARLRLRPKGARAPGPRRAFQPRHDPPRYLRDPAHPGGLRGGRGVWIWLRAGRGPRGRDRQPLPGGARGGGQALRRVPGLPTIWRWRSSTTSRGRTARGARPSLLCIGGSFPRTPPGVNRYVAAHRAGASVLDARDHRGRRPRLHPGERRRIAGGPGAGAAAAREVRRSRPATQRGRRRLGRRARIQCAARSPARARRPASRCCSATRTCSGRRCTGRRTSACPGRSTSMARRCQGSRCFAPGSTTVSDSSRPTTPRTSTTCSRCGWIRASRTTTCSTASRCRSSAARSPSRCGTPTARCGPRAARSGPRTSGAVVYRTAERAFAVKSTRLDAFQYYEGFYVLSKARSLDQWLAGAAAEPRADVEFHLRGRRRQHPLRLERSRSGPEGGRRLSSRRRGVDARPTSGRRLHDVDDYPRLLNPPGGYVQNANNPPRFVSARDPIDMTRYPSYFERGPLALRPQLALDMLESKQTFTVDDVIALKHSTRMLLAERVKPDLIEAVRAANAGGNGSADVRSHLTDGLAALEAWDNTVSAGSRGAVLFQRFWDLYSRAVRPAVRDAVGRVSVRRPRRAASATAAAAVTHLAAAVRAVREQFGSERVAWGDVHRFRAGSLDLPGDGITGTYGAYRVMTFDPRARVGPTRVAGHVPGRPSRSGSATPGSCWWISRSPATALVRARVRPDRTTGFAAQQRPVAPVRRPQAAAGAGTARRTSRRISNARIARDRVRTCTSHRPHPVAPALGRTRSTLAILDVSRERISDQTVRPAAGCPRDSIHRGVLSRLPAQEARDRSGAAAAESRSPDPDGGGAAA